MPVLLAKIAVEPVPAVVILPLEVTVTAPVPSAEIPLAPAAPVVILPVEVTVAAPVGA
jgi:hypothetical protein